MAVIGGIGSGKTAVTNYLASRGAVIVDADEIARAVVAPGEPALAQLCDAFGTSVLGAAGELDRQFVADIVFHDASALRRLNHITHGAIGMEMAAQISQHQDHDLVVVAIPLFREIHRELFTLAEVWCVWVEPEIAVQRLVEQRGFTAEDALSRIKNQPTNEERFAFATRKFHNSGTPEELNQQLQRALESNGWLRG